MKKPHKKVPRKIVESMNKIAHYSQSMSAHVEIVEGWLKDNGIDPEDLRKGDGVGLDEIEYGNANIVMATVGIIETLLNCEVDE